MNPFYLFAIGFALLGIGAYGLTHSHRNETRDIASIVFLGAGLLTSVAAVFWAIWYLKGFV